MLKNILALFVFTTIVANVFSQVCVPDPKYTRPALYPDSATGFATGYAAHPYLQVMTVIVPKDTTVIKGLPAIPFDSIVMKSLTGLPAGFTYACSPSKCSWPGNTKGCIAITGNPQESDVGTYPLQFAGKAYLGGGSISQPINLNYYTIKIMSTLGVPQLDRSRLSVAQNYPNPFSYRTSFSISVPETGDVTMNVYNVLGKLVHTDKFKALQGLNQMEFERKNLASGIYTYTFLYKDAIVAGRMAVE